MAQDYIKAIGLRGGYSGGIDYKYFINDDYAYEGILTMRWGGIKLTALKAYHQPFMWNYSDKIFTYWGYGAHVGHYNKFSYSYFMSPSSRPIRRNLYYTVIGLDGVLGIEYRVLKYPIVFSVEYIPYFDLFGPNYFNFHFGDGFISIRYTF